MPQHQNEFPVSQVVRPISCRSPYSRWVDVQIGTVSILFSYGIPFGLDSIAGCFVLSSPTRATSKHQNLWRDRTLHTVVSPELFDSYLLAALQSESQSLRGLAMSTGNELPSTPSADPEVDQLNSFATDADDELPEDLPAEENWDDEEDEDEDDWNEPEDDEDDDDEKD